MRTLSLCCGLALLAACSKPESQVAQDTTAAAPAAPAPISLAAIAGKWSMRTMAAGSDSVLVTYELNATGDEAGWTLTFPNGAPVPSRVSVSGDSIVTETGPYESALRKGVQVTTHAVFRLVADELVGTGVAHYTVAGPDSVLQLHMRGSRMQ